MNNRQLRKDGALDELLDSARESYRKIQAPAYLRAKVLTPRQKRDIFSRSMMRPAAALASLALVMGCVLLALPRLTSPTTPTGTPMDTHTVSYSGTLARGASITGEDGTTLMAVAENCIRLDMDFGCDAFVVINCGKLLLPDEDGNLHYAGQSGFIPTGQAAYWSVDPGTSQDTPVAQFMDSHENTLATLTLSYQTEEGVWYAFTEN